MFAFSPRLYFSTEKWTDVAGLSRWLWSDVVLHKTPSDHLVANSLHIPAAFFCVFSYCFQIMAKMFSLEVIFQSVLLWTHEAPSAIKCHYYCHIPPTLSWKPTFKSLWERSYMITPMGLIVFKYTHTHTFLYGICGLWGLFTDVMYFILKTLIILPYPTPTPKPNPQRKPVAILWMSKSLFRGSVQYDDIYIKCNPG